MFEANAAGMQADASIGVATRCAVFQIATNWTAHGRQLAADLVVAPCVKMYLKKGETIRVTDDLVVEDGLLGIGTLVVVGVALVLLLVAQEPVCQRAFRLTRFVLHQRPVGLLHGSHTEHLVETRQCLAGSREDHYPTHRTIQAMYDAEEYGTGLGILLLDICLHRLGEWGVAGLVALHDLPCTLRDDDYVVIFV